MKILYAERFAGEFNWELMCWIPHLRWLSQKYEYVITRCDKDYQFFYEFADKIFYKRRPKMAIGIKGDGVPFGIEQEIPGDRKFRYWLRRVNKKNIHKVWPTEKNCSNRNKMKFIEYGTYQKDLDYDLVFHAKYKRRFSKRSLAPITQGWPMINWGELLDTLPKMRICCIGRKARYVPGTDDRRDLSWVDLCNLMRSSTLMISPASAHAHLSNLCGLPLVVWGPHKKHHALKFSQSWKPFNVPVSEITHSNYKPSVKSVLRTTLSFMEKANEYRRHKNNDR